MADARDQEIAELRKLVSDLRGLVESQAKVIAEQARQIETLQSEVASLKEQLRQSSNNSSKPPSSDGPASPPRRAKKPTGRKPGGQPGHEGHQRALVPAERVDRRVPCRPSRCRGCKGHLHGTDHAPRLHQVFDLPQVKPVVTQYELHTLACGRCGKTTEGELPDGVPSGAFGPSVTAVIALLMGVYRLGKRPVETLMADLFGLEMSLGSVIKCQEQASAALAASHAEAHAYVQAQPVKHADETGWREARSRAWLWTAVTASVTVFMIHARRNAAAARELLGAAFGTLVTDRWGAYGWWPTLERQLCWAHLTRDFIKIRERGGDDAPLADELLAERDQMFDWWHRVRDGTLARSTFSNYMRPLQGRVHALLERGETHSHAHTAETCRLLRKHFHALWTFAYRAGVEPTNNAAELRVRHGVLWRKTSYGTHSAEGSRFVERILTVHASLRQQNRNVLEFLRAACDASLRNQRGPSLLPFTPASAHAAA